jgi:hypothetical protein
MDSVLGPSGVLCVHMAVIEICASGVFLCTAVVRASSPSPFSLLCAAPQVAE